MRLAWDLGASHWEAPRRDAGIVPLSGYLWKRKRNQQLGTPAWNKRWFSVEGENLHWYKTSSAEEPSGKIPLLSISRIVRGRKEEGGALAFTITARSRNFLLRGATPGE
eukprot:6218820-Prorocentrum_lima.AAC.1